MNATLIIHISKENQFAPSVEFDFILNIKVSLIVKPQVNHQSKRVSFQLLP